MKLKKLLASVTAAVMAVTAMAFSSLTASAATDITIDFEDKAYEIRLSSYTNGYWSSSTGVTTAWDPGTDEKYTYDEIKDNSIVVNWPELPNLVEYGLTKSDLRISLSVTFRQKNDDGSEVLYMCNGYDNYLTPDTASTAIKISDINHVQKITVGELGAGTESLTPPPSDSVIDSIQYSVTIVNEKFQKIAQTVANAGGSTITINSGDTSTPTINYDEDSTAEEEPLQPTPDPVQPSPDPMQSTPPQTNSNTAPTAGIPGAIIGAKKPAETTAADTSSDTGGSTSVELKTPAKITKELIDSVSGKDNVELKLDEGVTWEFTVSDLGKAEGMDLSVILDTDDITKAQADSISKESETMQFRIVHDGEFGFNAKLNIPVASRYNGLYANLYRLNGDELEYVCSSLVENKIASFDMDHASSYIIFFNRVSFVENIAAGAGIYADESGTSSAAPAAVCISFAALAAVSAVTIKKRA